MDDLEHSLLSSGALVHNLSHSPVSQARSDELYATDQEAWILERAKNFKRPDKGIMDRLVDGVSRSLGFKEGERKKIEEDIVVAAPGKVILFGEHAVVHGVVSNSPCICCIELTYRPPSLRALTCVASLSSRHEPTIKSPWKSQTSGQTWNGISLLCHGTSSL
jgi:hypothetical protein